MPTQVTVTRAGSTQVTVSRDLPNATHIQGVAVSTTAPSAGQMLRATSATAAAWSTFTIPNTFAAGDIIYASAANTLTALAKGTARQLLQMNAGATLPEWSSNIDIPGTLDVTGAATLDGTLYVSGGVTLSNSIGIGVGPDANHEVTIAGSIVGGATRAAGLYVAPTITPGFSVGVSIFQVGGTIVEGTGLSLGLLAGARFDAPSITAGTSTATNAATVYIAGAPSATVSGGNYALWVDDGAVRLDSTLTVQTATVGLGAGADASNMAVGVNALASNTTGSSNAAFGAGALFANTTGVGNSAFGRDALYFNTTGQDNSAFGRLALRDNTTGMRNSAFGMQALLACTTGGENAAFGRWALAALTTGERNTAIGAGALTSTVVGIAHTAVGMDALDRLVTGDYNTALGADAMYPLVTGSHNVAIGKDAGRYIVGTLAAAQTLSECIYIGSQSKPSADTITNEIAVGYNVEGFGANTITLGNSANTTIVPGADNVASLGATTRRFKNLNLSGDITVATNKFTVAAASGNTVIAGTLNVSGLSTFGADIIVPATSKVRLDGSATGDTYIEEQGGDNVRLVVGGQSLFVAALAGGITLNLRSSELVLANPSTRTTIGANGAATALTANPVGYIDIDIGGFNYQMPYYNRGA